MYRSVMIIGLLLIASCLPAQEYGLYQMREVWNSSHLNPGFFPRQEFIFSLPSVHTSLNAIGINQERLFEYNSAENTNYLNLDGVVGELQRDLVLKSSTIVDGLGVGGRIGKFFVSLSTSSVLDGEFTLPEALLRTVWEGTEEYLDQPLNIGPAANMIAYQKVGLGLNYEVNPRLAVGMRINRLLGGGSFVTNRSGLTLTQSSDIYQTTAELDYEVFYYGAGQNNLLDQTIEGFENFGDALDSEGMAPEGGTGLQQYTNRNNGWSLDLGAEYLLGDRLTLSASLLNLGSIRWENATQQVNLTGTVNFEGVDAANLDGEDFEVVPGIDTVGTFEATSNVRYTQALSPRTYLGVNYQLFPFWNVGGVLYNEFFTGGTFTALSLSTRFSLGRIFSLGGVYSLQNGTFNSLGANAALKLGPVQVYAIADNLSSVINEERLDGTNFRAGLNLTFGRKKSDLKLAAARSTGAESPVSPLHEPVVVEPSDEQENNEGINAQGKEKATLPNLPAVKQEPALVEEANTPNPEPELREPATSDESNLVDKPVSDEQLLKIEPAPEKEPDYPENHPANAAAVRLFPFELELRDSKDLGLIEEALVDVYRIEEGGFFKLIQTEKAINGRVTMQLAAEKAPYQAVVKANRYDSLLVDFRPERKSSLDQVVFLSSIQEEPSGALEITRDKPATTEPSGEVQEQVVAPLSTGPATNQDSLLKEPAPQFAEPTEDDATVPDERAEAPDGPAPSYPTYLLTRRTSLREAPDAQSRVISRMPVDTELKLLEKTNKWWWKVSMGGWDGYVKAALLRLRD